jgi:hypothetical protein
MKSNPGDAMAGLEYQLNRAPEKRPSLTACANSVKPRARTFSSQPAIPPSFPPIKQNSSFFSLVMC